MASGIVRKGITPVVAIVMLLMLTIVVAGGAFAFLTGFFEEQRDEITTAQNTEVQFKSLTCDAANDEISFLVKNTGDINIDMTTVDIYVTAVSNSSLVGDPISTSRASDLTVNDRHWSGTEPLNGGSFNAGSSYEVEIEFTSNDGPTIRSRCTP